MNSSLERLSAALADRYNLVREIGAGGMATVYLARDVRHDREVAIKVLKPELGAVLGVERFLSEIKVTANLQHPNLLPFFDSGEAEGLLFYVMPFVEGETLRARLDREQLLPVDEAVRIATAIAGALSYAHERHADPRSGTRWLRRRVVPRRRERAVPAADGTGNRRAASPVGRSRRRNGGGPHAPA
jgi:serine/threonine protein kinase